MVDGPRLQQRSEKRHPTMPARRKMAEVTRNPIADWPAGGRPAREALGASAWPDRWVDRRVRVEKDDTRARGEDGRRRVMRCDAGNAT